MATVATAVRRDPALADLLRESAALTTRLASDTLRPLARAGQVSASWASRWRTEGRGPVDEHTQFLYALARGNRTTEAHAIVEHYGATVDHGAVRHLSDRDLVRLYHEYGEREQRAEGEENARTNAVAYARDRFAAMAAEEEATLREAAYARKRVAASRELRRRRLDPYAYDTGPAWPTNGSGR